MLQLLYLFNLFSVPQRPFGALHGGRAGTDIKQTRKRKGVQGVLHAHYWKVKPMGICRTEHQEKKKQKEIK